SGNELWPVNGRFVDIAVTGVTDPEGGEVSLRSTGVVSDEPATSPGRAGFEADAVLGDGGHVQLRAERLGRGDGRVYRVAFTASDPAGATCEGEVVVRVDHDRRNDGAASDDGQRHDVVRGPGA
ncbi:MAG: hypothetical protein OEY23_19085, partial [Acidimicrobiia bacterium]|nr:hypothetical protein [Acidimicrobiia bacterium]